MFSASSPWLARLHAQMRRARAFFNSGAGARGFQTSARTGMPMRSNFTSSRFQDSAYKTLVGNMPIYATLIVGVGALSNIAYNWTGDYIWRANNKGKLFDEVIPSRFPNLPPGTEDVEETAPAEEEHAEESSESTEMSEVPKEVPAAEEAEAKPEEPEPAAAVPEKPAKEKKQSKKGEKNKAGKKEKEKKSKEDKVKKAKKKKKPEAGEEQAPADLEFLEDEDARALLILQMVWTDAFSRYLQTAAERTPAGSNPSDTPQAEPELIAPAAEAEKKEH
jgi:type IV secretory pathway VirB10-like protein